MQGVNRDGPPQRSLRSNKETGAPIVRVYDVRAAQMSPDTGRSDKVEFVLERDGVALDSVKAKLGCDFWRSAEDTDVGSALRDVARERANVRKGTTA